MNRKGFWIFWAIVAIVLSTVIGAALQSFEWGVVIAIVLIAIVWGLFFLFGSDKVNNNSKRYDAPSENKGEKIVKQPTVKKKKNVQLSSVRQDFFRELATKPQYIKLDGYTFRKNREGYTILRYKGAEQEIKIPSKIDGMPVTKINSGAFKNCICLETAIIPNGIKEIGESAFDRCYNLRKIIIPRSVKVMGPYAFRDCAILKIYIKSAKIPIKWDSAWNVSDCLVELEYKDNNVWEGLKEDDGISKQ